jgi:hypothetical protein
MLFQILIRCPCSFTSVVGACGSRRCVSFLPRRVQWERDLANWWVREEHSLVVAADTVEQHELHGIRSCPAEE